MVLKEKDFVEIDYTGMIKENMSVFDTTDKKLAVDEGLTKNADKLEPAIICLGEGQIIKGIDNNLIGKEIGKHEFDVTPEAGFGKKDAKLIQLIPTAKFKKQNIRPEPGLSVEIDNAVGKVRAVTGGRTIVDFNHPLSGLELHYMVKVNRVITDMKEKLESVLKSFLNMKAEDVKIDDGKSAIIITKEEFPQALVDAIKPKIVEMVGIEDIKFEKLEKNKNTVEIKDSKKEVE